MTLYQILKAIGQINSMPDLSAVVAAVQARRSALGAQTIVTLKQGDKVNVVRAGVVEMTGTILAVKIKRVRFQNEADGKIWMVPATMIVPTSAAPATAPQAAPAKPLITYGLTPGQKAALTKKKRALAAEAAAELAFEAAHS